MINSVSSGSPVQSVVATAPKPQAQPAPPAKPAEDTVHLSSQAVAAASKAADGGGK